MASVKRSNLTNVDICESAMDHAIDKYLEIAEIKSDMLVKFGGSKIDLVEFLRNREALPKKNLVATFNQNEINEKQSFEKISQTNEKISQTKSYPPIRKKIIKENQTPKNQNELF